MADTLDPKNADKRTWERYARSGRLDEKAYERFLKGLPDVTDKSSVIDTKMDDEPDMVDEEDDQDDAEA